MAAQAYQNASYNCLSTFGLVAQVPECARACQVGALMQDGCPFDDLTCHCVQRTQFIIDLLSPCLTNDSTCMEADVKGNSPSISKLMPHQDVSIADANISQHSRASSHQCAATSTRPPTIQSPNVRSNRQCRGPCHGLIRGLMGTRTRGRGRGLMITAGHGRIRIPAVTGVLRRLACRA